MFYILYPLMLYTCIKIIVYEKYIKRINRGLRCTNNPRNTQTS